MLVKYKPEGSTEPREWEFDPNRIRQSDAEMIEKRSGLSWTKFVEAIQSGSAQARKVLLWHLLRKDLHTLRLEDTPDFYMGELDVDYSLADLQKLRTQVSDSSMNDTEKSDALERLDLEIAGRLGKEYLDVEDLGKARSNGDD